jgi:hypothetical protein
MDLVPAYPKWRGLTAHALLFFAALLRYWPSYDHTAVVPRHPETYRIAYNLYEHGQFANPFLASDTGPSAHLSPLLPGLFAGLMMIFGVKSAGLWAIQLAGALVLAFQLSLYPLFSGALGMGRLTGATGAVVWILAKPQPFFGWEAFYASFGLALTCCLFRRHLDLQQPQWSSWMLGCLMGLLSLTAPPAIPVLAIWLAWDICNRGAVSFKRFVLPLLVLPALIVAPWTIRNGLVFHQFILVRDDLGLELAVSNNDCAQFSMQQNFNGCFQQFHPNRSGREAKRVIDLGEADYNQLRLRETLTWIKNHPRRFIQLSMYRFIAWWMPTESGTRRYVEYAGRDRLVERSLIYLVTLSSILGWMILYRRDLKSAFLCASCLAIFPIIYYFVQFQDRYRYPVMWLSFLLAALPITAYVDRYVPAPWYTHRL